MAALSLNILVQPCRDIQQHTADETFSLPPPFQIGMHLGLKMYESAPPCFLANVSDPAYYGMQSPIKVKIY